MAVSFVYPFSSDIRVTFAGHVTSMFWRQPRESRRSSWSEECSSQWAGKRGGRGGGGGGRGEDEGWEGVEGRREEGKRKREGGG